MSRFDRFLAGTFPAYQMRRMKAMQITAAYESAKPGRTHRAKKEQRGPNLPVAEGQRSIKEQVRWMEQNTDVVNGALDVLCANVVGLGNRPEPQVRDEDGRLMEDFNAELVELWNEWSKRPEVTWEFDEPAAQRLTARTLFRDGEVFFQHLIGNVRGLTHGTDVPYSYEMIESDLVPIELTDEKQGIIQGIEHNRWRRPTYYHVFKENPLDTTSVVTLRKNTKRIKAERMQHLKMVKRINQVRGVSVFASVIRRLADIEEIDESERVAARIAAAVAFYIKKGEPMIYAPPEENEDGYRELEFRPGMVFDDLEPGEDMGSIGSNRPNNELIPFRQDQFRAVAMGVGTSYSSLSKNYNGTYSSQRQELVEQAMHYRMVWSYFIAKSEYPKWLKFFEAGVLNGVIKVPQQANRRSILDPAYSPVATPWIEPLKEANAWKILNESGFESVEHINRMRGRDPREVERQLERERQTNQAPEEPEVDEGAEREEFIDTWSEVYRRAAE